MVSRPSADEMVDVDVDGLDVVGENTDVDVVIGSDGCSGWAIAPSRPKPYPPML